MDSNKPKITIGIPALNEYKNLVRLLAEIEKQSLNRDKNLEIVIMSDGSTDKTNTLKDSTSNLNLRIYFSKNRHGKPYQINKLFRMADSDLVILLDADISFIDNNVLANLVSASQKNKQALISGVAVPEKPKNLVQKIAHAGVAISDKIRFSKGQSSLYLCEGSIRCFPKKLYQKLRFPSTSADEAYSYLASKRLGFGFISCQRAKVLYHLPENIKDYYLQQRRYLNSKIIQNNNFPNTNIQYEYQIPLKKKIRQLVSHFLIDPLYTMLYLLFIVWVKISVFISPAKFSSRWQILSSTKKI